MFSIRQFRHSFVVFYSFISDYQRLQCKTQYLFNERWSLNRRVPTRNSVRVTKIHQKGQICRWAGCVSDTSINSPKTLPYMLDSCFNCHDQVQSSSMYCKSGMSEELKNWEVDLCENLALFNLENSSMDPENEVRVETDR